MTKRNPILSIIKDFLYYGLESMGRYYSSYRAFVYDNKDPKNLQRLQLIIPEVGGTSPYAYWAFPKGAFNGTGYGCQIIPAIQEMVWVEFERGHPDVPIYMHGHFGNGELPTDDPDMLDVNCYWFRSPYGHTIKLNDTKKYITIKSSGAEITIDANGKYTIKNGQMDLKSLLTNIMETYITTTTVDEEPLSSDSIQAATQNIKDINNLFT